MSWADIVLGFIRSAERGAIALGVSWCDRGDHYTFDRCKWRRVRPGLISNCCAPCVGEPIDGRNFNAPIGEGS